MADTTPRQLRVAAIYDRAAGLGDVLLDPGSRTTPRAGSADTALFVAGGAEADVALALRGRHPGVRPLSRSEYLDTRPRSQCRRARGASG